MEFEEKLECVICTFPAHTAIKCNTCHQLMHEECTENLKENECPHCRASPLQTEICVLARRMLDIQSECRFGCGYKESIYHVRVHEVECYLSQGPRKKYTEISHSEHKRRQEGILVMKIHPHSLLPLLEKTYECAGKRIFEQGCFASKGEDGCPTSEIFGKFVCKKCSFKICEMCLLNVYRATRVDETINADEKDRALSAIEEETQRAFSEAQLKKESDEVAAPSLDDAGSLQVPE